MSHLRDVLQHPTGILDGSDGRAIKLGRSLLSGVDSLGGGLNQGTRQSDESAVQLGQFLVLHVLQLLGRGSDGRLCAETEL